MTLIRLPSALQQRHASLGPRTGLFWSIVVGYKRPCAATTSLAPLRPTSHRLLLDSAQQNLTGAAGCSEASRPVPHAFSLPAAALGTDLQRVVGHWLAHARLPTGWTLAPNTRLRLWVVLGSEADTVIPHRTDLEPSATFLSVMYLLYLISRQ